MKVTPVASAGAVQQTQDSGRTQVARALAAFASASETAPTNHPTTLNQNAISPENASAVMQSSGHKDQIDSSLAESAVEHTPVEKVEPLKPVDSKEQDPALSRQFAQLARQERALRAKVQAQEQAIKARESELLAREEAIKAQSNEYSQGYISRDQLKQDTLSVLAEAGISYDELTQQILNQPNRDPRVEAHMSRLEAKIRELEAKNEQTVKQAQENQSQAYQAAVKQIEVDVRNLVAKNPDFETIKATGSSKDVVELITETYNKDGILLTVEDAAQQVEDYLTEQAMKLTRIEKIKRRLQPNQPVAPQGQGSQQQKTQTSAQGQTQPGMKTLTNATASSRKLSAKERAVLAFKGELKS